MGYYLNKSGEMQKKYSHIQAEKYDLPAKEYIINFFRRHGITLCYADRELGKLDYGVPDLRSTNTKHAIYIEVETKTAFDKYVKAGENVHIPYRKYKYLFYPAMFAICNPRYSDFVLIQKTQMLKASKHALIPYGKERDHKLPSHGCFMTEKAVYRKSPEKFFSVPYEYFFHFRSIENKDQLVHPVGMSIERAMEVLFRSF